MRRHRPLFDLRRTSDKYTPPGRGDCTASTDVKAKSAGDIPRTHRLLVSSKQVLSDSGGEGLFSLRAERLLLNTREGARWDLT